MPEELFITISIRIGRESPSRISTSSIAAAESEWMDTEPRSNGIRDRPFARSSASATRTMPASIVSGRPSWRWLVIVCSTSTVITSEVLQAITSHRDYGKPLTLEAGIVRVADALDMEQGRSRIPFARGQVSIHSLSAAAIEDVAIKDGEERPILIEITMNNSSGIYQVDELLKAKLQGSGLEPYVEVVAHIDTEAEKRLVPIYRLET